MSKTKVIIMGAAGRDFHNFNTVFRHNDAYEVVAFTATQIPKSKAAAIRPNWPVSCILSGFRSIRRRT
jgi:predicted GTPase